MRLLLDTHSLLWWLAQPELLSTEAREAISDPSNEVCVSAASAWEIAIKKVLGKLDAPDDLEFQIPENRFTPLPIDVKHGLAIGALPPTHRDPFDRMLVVQARLEGLLLVTRDEIIPSYDVPVLLA